MGLLALRYVAVVVGTVLWDVGAVVQKKAVARLPQGALRVTALLGSAPWMAGLVVTAAGWGAYVFGMQRIPLSVARTVSGGSYVILALFSLIFLRTPLRPAEWLAVALVTAGILLLGYDDRSAQASAAALAPAAPLPGRVLGGLGLIVAVSAAIALLASIPGPGARPLVKPMVAFATLSGLLSSAGDLLVKVLMLLAGAPAPPGSRILLFILTGLGLVVFYLAGFYALSRSYQVGSMVGSVVISDFSARVGAILLGAVALSERLVGVGSRGSVRAIGFLAVLGGSLLLGRFSEAAPRAQGSP